MIDFGELHRFPTVDELMELMSVGFRMVGHPFDAKTEAACRHAIEGDGVEEIVKWCLQAVPPALRESTLARMRGRLN